MSDSHFSVLSLSRRQGRICLGHHEVRFLRTGTSTRRGNKAFSIGGLRRRIGGVGSGLSGLRSSPGARKLSFRRVNFSCLFISRTRGCGGLPACNLTVTKVASSGSGHDRDLLRGYACLHRVNRKHGVIFTANAPIAGAVNRLCGVRQCLTPGLLRERNLSSFPS